MTARVRTLLFASATAFFGLHLWSMPPALEDPDSINFALGVESFDVAKHQPHPPGYPAYIALGKASTWIVDAVRPGWDRDRRKAAGLSVLGAIAGAVGVVVLVQFWVTAGLAPGVALLAAVLAVVSPLFWITASRPLTDVVGLVAALAVQIWLIRGWKEFRDAPGFPRVWLLAALGVGIVPGLRSQTAWLVGPLACLVVGALAGRRRWPDVIRFSALVALGGLVWLVPLLAFSGGLGAYLTTLGAQGAEDFVGVEMLATTPTLDMLRFALDRTFLVPWQAPWLGQLVVVAAIFGIVRLARTDRRVLAGLGLAFVPYLLFHLTFQETLYTRYALPLVVPIAGLAVIGIAGFAGRFATAIAGALIAASLVVTYPEARAYAAEMSPLSTLVRDMIGARRLSAAPPVLTMHHPLWWSSRRTLDWYRSSWTVGHQPFPGDREWLGIVTHFREGRTEPVWLMADPHRTDIALIDRRAQTVRGRYARRAGLQRLIGGDLLETSVWLQFDEPAWMLGRGWALTPEAAGATAQDNRQPHRQPAEGWIRRADGEFRLMLGGRYLGGNQPAVVAVSIDGGQVARWTVPQSPIWWVRWLDVPAGALRSGEGPYAPLTVAVEAADGGADRPELGLEQFDFAPVDAFIYAFGEGWQELEQDARSGTSWRWASDRNTITVYSGGRDLELVLSGESPLEYFDAAPTVRVLAGGEEVERFEASDDFTRTIRIPSRLIEARPTTLTVETSRAFVPAEVSDSLDRRRLGLRLYRVELRER